MVESRTFESEIAGRRLTIETGALAEQATSAVIVRYGETIVLVTLCVGERRESVDFLPLTIDYEERLYAAGKIPGGFIRREGRPSESAILASRLTDRALRPLLPKEWRNDLQIVITVLSADQENDPDILALIGGSAVLAMSEVPFAGPVAAVRIGYINEQLVVNPTLAQVAESRLDLVVASTKDSIVMVEAGAREVSEETIIQAMQQAYDANRPVVELQEKLCEALGKSKAEVPPGVVTPEMVATISSIVGDRLGQVFKYKTKEEREQALSGLRKEVIERLGEQPQEDMMAAFDAKVKSELRTMAIEKGERLGGRGLTEIRPLSCQVGILPRTHGSALFTRGQTQVLTITTLGSSRMEQQIDGLGLEETKRFMHHYNFPPFSTGEVKRMGTPGRREIGHGALVERALEPVVPREEDFPYTIRLVSEVLSSSGSTSMASVCAGSMSLMDAGVPVKAAVSGIAMGLITGNGKFAVLTDIEGAEDQYGDMDFKVAGTREGVTALQMDIKVRGISFDVLDKALKQAHEARMFILDVMNRAISAPRAELSRYAPRMYKITIDPDKIGAVIGSGGKTIRSIIEQTKTSIDIDDSGTVLIGATDETSARKAIDIIEGLTKEIEVGTVYTGKVTRILNFGAMVEVLPGKEGLVHISELADYRVASVEDVVKVGDEVMVKVVGVDNLGRVNLSRRAVMEKPSERPEGETQEGRPHAKGPPPFRPHRREHDSEPARTPRNRPPQKR